MANRTKTINHVILGLIVATFGGFIIARTNHNTNAQVSTPCQAGYNLLVPTVLPDSTINLTVSQTATTTVSVQDAVFKIDGAILGRGVQTGTNAQWQMVWNTQYSNPGQHTITADMHLFDGTICPVPPVITNLTSAAVVAPLINAVAIPVSFQGLTNQVINFNLMANVTSTSYGAVDVSQYTYFNNKMTSIGSIIPLDGTQILKFSSGPVAGTGYIRVTASYGGLPSKIITIPVTVLAQTADSTSTTSPSNTTTSTVTTTTSSGSTQTTIATPLATTTPTDAAIAAASTASIEAEKPLKDCVFNKLGEVRYKAISSGLSRPTAAEFEAMNQCFATRNNVLPSSFVPVAPSEVKNKPITADASVNKLENVTTEGTVKLKLNGKAKPKSLVLLYVYSEPLVLSTTADSNGDWSYALEDPLQPGKHEAYAVVDKGDGTYQRSSVFDFAIAKASASAANPNGYSLKLISIQATAKDSSKMNRLYVGGIGLLTLVMLSAIGFAILKTRKSKSAAPEAMQNPPAAEPATPAAPITAAVSTQSPAQPEVMPVQAPETVQPTVVMPPTTPTEPVAPAVTSEPVATEVPPTGDSHES